MWLSNHSERAVEYLDRYFGGIDGFAYQGREFEWFIERSTRSAFTAEDFLAIGALSVQVPAFTARAIIEDCEGEYRDLLAHCHSLIDLDGGEAQLASCPEMWLTNNTSPFVELYWKLHREPHCGRVITSKLMATKFPGLIPIRDARVEWVLDHVATDEWWLPIRELLTTPMSGSSVGDYLDGLQGSGVFAHVTALRRLDVVLWMEATARRPQLQRSRPR